MKQAVSNLRHIARVYFLLLRLSIMSRITYPGNAILAFINVMGDMLIYFAFANIIFSFVPSVGGFSNDQLYIVIGTSMILETISWLTFRAGTSHLPDNVINGKIESSFTKPLPSQFLATFTRMDIEDLSRAVIGLMLIVPHAGALANPVPLHIALYCVSLVLSSIINFSMMSNVGSLSFILGKMDGMWGLLNYINDTTRYPHTIFSKKIQWIFFTIIPTAFLGSVPTLVLTSNNHWMWLGISAGVALISFWVSTIVWNRLSRRYSGASG